VDALVERERRGTHAFGRLTVRSLEPLVDGVEHVLRVEWGGGGAPPPQAKRFDKKTNVYDEKVCWKKNVLCAFVEEKCKKFSLSGT
jgi:hypothetical protein